MSVVQPIVHINLIEKNKEKLEFWFYDSIINLVASVVMLLCYCAPYRKSTDLNWFSCLQLNSLDKEFLLFLLHQPLLQINNCLKGEPLNDVFLTLTFQIRRADQGNMRAGEGNGIITEIIKWCRE